MVSITINLDDETIKAIDRVLSGDWDISIQEYIEDTIVEKLNEIGAYK